jgi:hypothetical protein
MLVRGFVSFPSRCSCSSSASSASSRASSQSDSASAMSTMIAQDAAESVAPMNWLSGAEGNHLLSVCAAMTSFRSAWGLCVKIRLRKLTGPMGVWSVKASSTQLQEPRFERWCKAWKRAVMSSWTRDRFWLPAARGTSNEARKEFGS